jgi:FkbM family methyltransferase
MINFPQNIKKIRFDVGTGSTAPNTALWLKNNKDTAALCFEADPRNYDILISGGSTNQYQNKLRLSKKKYLLKNGKIVKKIDPKTVKIFNIAISNSKKKKLNFYLTDKKNFGTSSLLVPIEEKLKQRIVKKIKIPTIKLEYFLREIDFDKFKYIEFLKIDTQGNDINVLKSCKKYLNKICFVQAEYWAYNAYKGEKNRYNSLNSIVKFMKKKNFDMYYYTVTDVYFVNNSLKKYIFLDNVLDNTIDFENGLYRKSFFINYFPGKLVFYANIISFLRSFAIFNYIFYKIFKINFKKFL